MDTTVLLVRKKLVVVQVYREQKNKRGERNRVQKTNVGEIAQLNKKA